MEVGTVGDGWWRTVLEGYLLDGTPAGVTAAVSMTIVASGSG